MNDSLIQLRALLPDTLRYKPWLAELSLRQHELAPRTRLFNAGANPQRLYFVAKGWLAESVGLTPTKQPINLVRIRGDAIGLDSLDQSGAAHEVNTVTHAQLVSVPMEQWRRCLERDSTLIWWMHRAMARDMRDLSLMNAVIGHFKAPQRLAAFLLIMLARTRSVFHTRMDTLNLPLTQEEIGLLLGLTNVSVNRAFRTLEQQGFIQTSRQSVSMVDEDALMRSLNMDSWAPVVQPALAAE